MTNIVIFEDPLAKLLGDWSMSLDIYSVIFRLALAVLAGAIIGCERSNKRHSAGLRTFILITLLGSVAMMLDLAIVGDSSTPLYLFSAASILGTVVVSGNSILFNAKKQIKGLTTSVGLWVCLLLGLVIGIGFYLIALILLALLVAILMLFPFIEIALKNRSNHFEIHLELTEKAKLQDFIYTLRKLSISVDELEINSAYIGSGLSVYTIALTLEGKENKLTHKEIITALSSLPYVSFVNEI